MQDDVIRFLIVDDIRENLVALDALLRRDGLEIHQANSANEALELMLVNDYALALVDVQMPEVDGYELAELMRRAERTRKVPIIFVTAAEMNENRRFRGYEAGAVDYIFKPINPLILKSKAEVFFRIGRQAQELARQTERMRKMASDLSDAMARVRAHTDNSPLAFVDLDSSLVIRSWSEGAERMFGRSAVSMVGNRIDETGWMCEHGVDLLRSWLTASWIEQAPVRHSTEMPLNRVDGDKVHCEVYGSVLSDPGGKRHSLSIQLLDITDRHKSEEVQRLLVGELNHRVKNSLANVQAIARQTMRQSKTPEEFETTFSGRLQALARAHSILSRSTWQGATLAELIDDQTKAGTLDGTAIYVDGPSIELSPESMLRMALTLHELGTNAAKYGAFSVPGGRVDLTWHTDGADLVIDWRETGGPAVLPPDHQGFGSTLIRSSAGPDGVSVTWAPEGVHWTIRIPQPVQNNNDAPQGAKSMPDNTAYARKDIAGLKVLVVEDEPLIAMDLVGELEDAGAIIAGVARTLTEALTMGATMDVDVALLDGNLNGEKVDPLAELLSQRDIPFCFVSGYGREHLPQAFPHVPVVEKPFRPDLLRSVMCQVAKQSAAA